jgi:hypothetical protein
MSLPMVLSENESPEVGLNKNPLSLTAIFFFIFIAEILYYKSISKEEVKCYTFLGKMYENLGQKKLTSKFLISIIEF